MVAKEFIGREEMERVARVVHGRWLSSAYDRSPREDQWELDYKRADPTWLDITRIKTPPFVKVPLTFRQIRQKHGWLWRTVRTDASWRTFYDTTPENREAGRLMTRLTQHNLNRKHFDLRRSNETILYRGLGMALKFGINYFSARWEEHGDQWGVRLLNLPAEDVYPDWTEGRWFIVRRYVTVAEMGDLAVALAQAATVLPMVDGKGREVSSAPQIILDNWQHLYDEVKLGNKSRSRYAHWWSVDSKRHQRNVGRISSDDTYGDDMFVSAEDDPLLARVPLLEYHERRADGLVVKLVPSFGVDGRDLIFQSSTSPYGMCQVIPFIPYAIDEEEWGHSIPYIIGQQEESAGYSYRAQLRYIARVADPAILYRSHVKFRRQYQSMLSNVPIEVQNVDNDIKFMDPPSNPTFHAMGMQMIRENVDFTMAEGPSRRGQASGEKTATAAQQMWEGASVDDQLMAFCGISALGHLMKLQAEIFQVHLTEPKAIQVLGSSGPEILKLSPEYLTGNFEVYQVSPVIGQSPQVRQQALATAFQTFAPTGLVDVQRIAEEFFSLGGFNPDEFLRAGGQRTPMKPDQEHMQILEFAQAPVPSMREDFMFHLGEHMVMRNEWVRLLGEGAPPLLQLDEHIQVTMQMMQAMQQSGPQVGTPAGPQKLGTGANAMRARGGDPQHNPNVPAMAPGRRGLVT